MNDGSPVIKGTSYALNNHASITGKSRDLSIRHNGHTRCEAQSTSYTRFKAFATKQMRSAIFWDITERIVVIPSEQPIGSIFQGSRSPRRKGPIGCPETSPALPKNNSDISVLYKRHRGQFAQMQCIQSMHLINYYHLRLCYKRVELVYLHFLICMRGIK